MGNTFTKLDYRSFSIDGGKAQIKDPPSPNLHQQPISNTTNRMSAAIRPDPNEYDPLIVGKLIAKKKLAPFYEGNFDERNGASVRSDKASVITTESTRRRNLAQRQIKLKKIKKSKGIFKATKENPSVVDQSWLNTNLTECPICLLWYPRNMNFTKCCKKPICTLCFVSMKRPVSAARLISCPFCRSVNHTVVYRSPEKILENGRYTKGVVCEHVRPPRSMIRQPQRPIYYRYNAGQGQSSSPTFARPSNNRPNQRFVFYSPAPSSNTTRRTSLGPSYPSRLYTGGSYPAANRTSVQPVVNNATTAVRPSYTQQDLISYEEAALSRAIRLSMLEY